MNFDDYLSNNLSTVFDYFGSGDSFSFETYKHGNKMKFLRGVVSAFLSVKDYSLSEIRDLLEDRGATFFYDPDDARVYVNPSTLSKVYKEVKSADFKLTDQLVAGGLNVTGNLTYTTLNGFIRCLYVDKQSNVRGGDSFFGEIIAPNSFDLERAINSVNAAGIPFNELLIKESLGLLGFDYNPDNVSDIINSLHGDINFETINRAYSSLMNEELGEELSEMPVDTVLNFAVGLIVTKKPELMGYGMPKLLDAFKRYVSSPGEHAFTSYLENNL